MGRNIKKRGEGGSLDMSEDDFSEEWDAAKTLMIEEIQFLASQRKSD